MIKIFISGIVNKINDSIVEINTDGEINKVVFYSKQDIMSMNIGQKINFYAEIVGRDDNDEDIYGYLSKNVRLFVEQFECVPGIGRKTAMDIYNNLTEKGMSMKSICLEIASKNVILLETIIAPKCAQRIIDSLNNSIKCFSDSELQSDNSLMLEAKEILLSLGFLNSDIDKAISKVNMSDKNSAMEVVEIVVNDLQ